MYVLFLKFIGACRTSLVSSGQSGSISLSLPSGPLSGPLGLICPVSIKSKYGPKSKRMRYIASENVAGISTVTLVEGIAFIPHESLCTVNEKHCNWCTSLYRAVYTSTLPSCNEVAVVSPVPRIIVCCIAVKTCILFRCVVFLLRRMVCSFPIFAF